MNVLTYATPVSVQPSRMWCIGLYKGTLSHENFDRRDGMSRPTHARTGKGGMMGRRRRSGGAMSMMMEVPRQRWGD